MRPRDRWGKCRVTAVLDGQSLHHDVFDPYSAYHRGSLAETVFSKATGFTPDESTDLRWIGDAVIAAAEAGRTQDDAGKADGQSTADLLVEFALARYRVGRTDTDEPFAVERDGPNIAIMFRGSAMHYAPRLLALP